MKTRTKTLAVVEIAIVLCSLFLVALPAIAAEQTAQKVSASEVTTSSEEYDIYVLDIYGNANEDDTIDMRDLTYVKLIFFGKKPETELADAKYDGKINPLDFIQIKLIIVGKEKELTVIDIVDRIVTLDMPVERIIVTEDKLGEVIRILGVEDKVVGIDPNMADTGFFPVMGDKPHVGNCMHGTLDYELLAELRPDLLLIHGHYGKSTDIIEKAEKMDIPVVCVDAYIGGKTSLKKEEPIDGRDIDLTADSQVHCFTILGTIFNRDEKAQEFLDWRTNLLEMIKDRTEDIEENDELDAWYGSIRDGCYSATGKGNKCTLVIDMVGLHNIAEFYGSGIVDPEWIIISNPDIIILTAGYIAGTITGYPATDPSKVEEFIRHAMEDPVLSQTTAVKTGRVYAIEFICLDVRPMVGAAYLGKVAYPERFKDIDPDEINREYFEKWLRVEHKGIQFWPNP